MNVSDFTTSRARVVSLPALLLALLLALAVGPGCDSDPKGYVAPPPPEVTVSRPVKRSVTVRAEYTGTTQAYAAVEIRARVEGYLQEVHFQPSSRVTKGQLLFSIDPKPLQAKLDEAQATLATARADLMQARATLQRKEKAYASRAVSEVEVIQAQADKAKAEASIKSAEAALETARINLGYTTIHSPVDGLVSRSLVDVGNLVGAGEATLLTTVVDDNPMYVYFNVSEKHLVKYLESGRQKDDMDERRARSVVTMGPGGSNRFPHTGNMDFMDNKVDSETGTIQVRAVFPNDEARLVPGMFVRLRLPIDKLENVLLVPDMAVGLDQGGRHLLVVNDQDTVEQRNVEAGPLDGDMRVILKGIKADDRVVVNGLQRARPGAKVRPVQAQETPAAADQNAGKTKQP